MKKLGEIFGTLLAVSVIILLIATSMAGTVLVLRWAFGA